MNERMGTLPPTASLLAGTSAFRDAYLDERHMAIALTLLTSLEGMTLAEVESVLAVAARMARENAVLPPINLSEECASRLGVRAGLPPLQPAAHRTTT